MSERDDRPSREALTDAQKRSLRAGLSRGQEHGPETERAELVEEQAWRQMVSGQLSAEDRRQLIERASGSLEEVSKLRDVLEVDAWSEDPSLSEWSESLARELASAGFGETASGRASAGDHASVRVMPRQEPRRHAWIRPALMAAMIFALLAAGWFGGRVMLTSRGSSGDALTVRGAESQVTPSPDAILNEAPLRLVWPTSEAEGWGSTAVRLTVLSEGGETVLELRAQAGTVELSEEHRSALSNGRFVWTVESQEGARIGPFWFAVEPPDPEAGSAVEGARP